MNNKYYHLTAIVNGESKDMLVSQEEYEDCESDPANFFVPDAKDAQNSGVVYLEPESSTHYLPETFG